MVELLPAPELNQADARHDYQRRFAEGREAAGATLKEVAAAAGVSFVVISQFERGLSSLSLPVFLKACAFLGVRTGYVLEGEGRMFSGARRQPTARGGRKAARVQDSAQQ